MYFFSGTPLDFFVGDEAEGLEAGAAAVAAFAGIVATQRQQEPIVDMVPSLFQIVADEILIRCKGNRGSSVLIEDSLGVGESKRIFDDFLVDGLWGLAETSVRIGGGGY